MSDTDMHTTAGKLADLLRRNEEAVRVESAQGPRGPEGPKATGCRSGWSAANRTGIG